MKKVSKLILIGAAVGVLGGAALYSNRMIQSTFENKIVYVDPQTAKDQEAQQADCASRGGTYSTCGSYCGPEAEVCMQACAHVCEFKKSEEAQ